ncbi:MAG: hypothetical protein V4754_19015 [Pseudomonadota bacterium]
MSTAAISEPGQPRPIVRRTAPTVARAVRPAEPAPAVTAEDLRRGLDADQVLAIGLVWGHLNTRQFRSAHLLARGCLCMWPGLAMLRLLDGYACGELGLPLAPATRAMLAGAQYRSLATLILRRATLDDVLRSVTPC